MGERVGQRVGQLRAVRGDDRAAVLEQLRATLERRPVSSVGHVGHSRVRLQPASGAGPFPGVAVDPAQLLPVLPPLAGLLPDGGLRRGGVVAILGPGPEVTAGPGWAGARGMTGGAGTSGTVGAPRSSGAQPGSAQPGSVQPGSVRPSGGTSLLLAMVAAASAAGSWAAVVGVRDLGAQAAAELGVELSRLALVPNPGPNLAGIAAALLDGVDLLALAGVERLAPAERSRLAARARQSGSVLLPLGPWPGADVVLRCSAARWSVSTESGIAAGGAAGTAGSGSAGWGSAGAGRGRLRTRELTVSAGGRGRLAGGGAVVLRLPGPDGRVQAVREAAVQIAAGGIGVGDVAAVRERAG